MAVLIAVEVVPIATVVSILRTIDAKQKLSRSTTGSATGRSVNRTSTSASKEVYPNSVSRLHNFCCLKQKFIEI